ncbi:hypothetical protein SAMN04488550_2924 [Gordonia malaquae]|nr:hypothetical protein SAMN04488550_2924 [Gordonia malaquae]
MASSATPSARSEARTESTVIGGRGEAVSDNYSVDVSFVRRGNAGADRLDTSLDVRLRRSEKLEVAARARSLGVKSSGWARAVIRDALDVGRADVAALHREAARQPDPERAGVVTQLRGVGVALNQEQRRRNHGFKVLDAVYERLKGSGQLDEELREKLFAAATALADETHAELIAEAIEKVDTMRVTFGDETRL